MADKTNEQVFRFLRVAEAYVEQKQAEAEQKKDKKHTKETKAEAQLLYALQREIKHVKPLHTTFTEAVENLDIEYCATEPLDDPNGVIKRDAKGELTFTKNGLRKRNEARNKLFQEKVSIEPHFAKSWPADLPQALREVFAGFVIPEDAAEIPEPVFPEDEEGEATENPADPAPHGQPDQSE